MLLVGGVVVHSRVVDRIEARAAIEQVLDAAEEVDVVGQVVAAVEIDIVASTIGEAIKQTGTQPALPGTGRARHAEPVAGNCGVWYDLR